MSQFPETELILTPEGRVYHINLLGEDIADDVIVVGDQGRVAQISSYFSKVDFKTEHREFITHTGWYNGKRITVLSTGIGTDNIDIVLNELDAAVNIDPKTRTLNSKLRSLNIIRLGTSGALQKDIPVNGLVVSTQQEKEIIIVVASYKLITFVGTRSTASPLSIAAGGTTRTCHKVSQTIRLQCCPRQKILGSIAENRVHITHKTVATQV